MAPHWFGGYVSIFSPQGVFGFSYPAVLHLYPVDYCRCCNLERKSFMPATGARPKKTKINLMDCICLMCSGVEIIAESWGLYQVRVGFGKHRKKVHKKTSAILNPLLTEPTHIFLFFAHYSFPVSF